MTFNETLESDRLILRRLTLHDVAVIFDYASDEQVSKFTTWENHKSFADTNAFLNFAMKKYEDNQPSEWGIVSKETNKVIGTCGWVYIKDEPHHRAEIGYVLSRSYWNQGITTEVVKLILNFGFNMLNLNRIEARCIAENVGSERVMQKVGMQYEGLMRESMFVKGRYVNVKLYSILNNEWKQILH